MVIVKVDKTYTLRNGLKTGPIRKSNNGTNYVWEAEVQEPEHKTPSVMSWKRYGAFLTGSLHKFDIVEDV